MSLITAAPKPIIESFLANYPANIVSIEFYYEEETQGRDIVISLDIFSEWLCSNHGDIISDFKYHNTEYSENLTNWFDMFTMIETFRKDIQNQFLNFYLNNF